MDYTYKLEQVLRVHKIEPLSWRVTEGPSVTLYEFRPDMGVNMTRVRRLADEFALAVGTESVRIMGPLAGGTIGIEVPNFQRQIVHMDSVLHHVDYESCRMALPCAIGKTVQGELFIRDLTQMPHLLIAGATGQGKSVCLNMLLLSLMSKRKPEEMQLVLIDPKQVELNIYAPLWHKYLADDIATTTEDAVAILQRVINLMEYRYTLLSQKGVRNIKEYNDKLNGEDYMRYCIVVIDEYADLIMTAGKDMERMICRIAQKARAVGIHMIIATQRPSATIVTGNIKANFPVRIAFRVASGIDSRVILDHTGAEDLMGKGDMLYSDGIDDVRVQCGYADTEYIEDAILLNLVCRGTFTGSVLDIPGQEDAPCVTVTIKGQPECLFLQESQGRTELTPRNFGMFPFLLTRRMAIEDFLTMVAIGVLDKPTGEGMDMRARILIRDRKEVLRRCEAARAGTLRL